MPKLLPFFRIVALLEGVSYLVLMINMIFFKNPDLVKPVGWAHGGLFMAYIVIAVLISSDMKWSTRTLLIVLLASVIPFGTFYIDKKYLTKSGRAKH